MTDVEELTEEIHGLVSARAELELGEDSSPTLFALAGPEEKIRVKDLQDDLDVMITRMPTAEYRIVMGVLLGSGPRRYAPVSERSDAAIEAAQLTGGKDAFRRRGSGTRWYAEAELAETWLSLSGDPGQLSADQMPTTGPPQDRRWSGYGRWLVVAGILVALAAIGLVRLVAGQGQTGGSDGALSCLPVGIGPDVAPDIGEAIAVLAEVEFGEAVCGREPALLVDDVVFQPVEIGHLEAGGILAWPDQDVLGQVKLVSLNLGQWQSYTRIGGADRSFTLLRGGRPTGEIKAFRDRWQLVLDGGVETFAEDPEGTYVWVPTAAMAVWESEGGPDGWLGWPTSSPFLRDGGNLVVEFQGGYLRQETDGSISAVEPLIDPDEELGDVELLIGTAVSTVDVTGWLIGDGPTRWWIPSGQVWTCSGADSVRRPEIFTSTAIYRIPYGGVATCPARIPGFDDSSGGVDLAVYCSSNNLGALSFLDSGEGGSTWACGGRETKPDDVCTWQYGSDVVATADPHDRYSWLCHRD